MRQLSLIDRILNEVNLGLNSAFVPGSALSKRENPAKKIQQDVLSINEKKHASGLMRVDHTGEICAQGLYRGQAFFARNPETRDALLRAAAEEQDHLAWCEERLKELSSHPSHLNFFWYPASFLIGVVAAALGDAWSNGFVVETENQVERHLTQHLKELPSSDEKSRVILEQMKTDEIEHAFSAKDRGAKELPFLIKALMALQSRVMTRTAYWV